MRCSWWRYSWRPLDTDPGSRALDQGSWHSRTKGLPFLHPGKDEYEINQLNSNAKSAHKNTLNPVYGVATICHQVRYIRWGHPSLFHTATPLLSWYKMLCVGDILYRLVWVKFMNKISMHAQFGTHKRFNWDIIAVLKQNPFVLMCVDITDAPKLLRKYVETWVFVAVSEQRPLEKNIRGSSYWGQNASLVGMFR